MVNLTAINPSEREKTVRYRNQSSSRAWFWLRDTDSQRLQHEWRDCFRGRRRYVAFRRADTWGL